MFLRNKQFNSFFAHVRLHEEIIGNPYLSLISTCRGKSTMRISKQIVLAGIVGIFSLASSVAVSYTHLRAHET